MSNILGWVAAIAVIYMACALSGSISIFLDVQTFIVILGFVYGSTSFLITQVIIQS